MLEKLLLATILTFALSLLAQVSWSFQSQATGSIDWENKPLFSLSERHN